MENRWGKKWNQWYILFFLGSKITAVSDCSHEIKRHLLLGRKAMTNLDSVLENRDITLLTKVHIVKAMGFPVVMYGCESWTMKKHWRIAWRALKNWYFWILVLAKSLETARKLNQSILKEINSIFFESIHAEALIFWPPGTEIQFIGKDPDVWRQGNRMTDGMIGCHHNSTT